MQTLPETAAIAEPRARSWELLGVLWPVASIAVFAALSVLYVWPHVPVDDAYITFRYADQLVAGHGLVWNPAERVEGYSSLSWLLLLAAFRALDVAPFTVVRALGLMLGSFTLLLQLRLNHSTASRVCAALALASSMPAVYHFNNGLETPLMALLLTLLAAPPERHATLASGLYLAAAGLIVVTRPEGVACVAVFIVADQLSRRRELGRSTWALAGVAVGSALAQLTFRYAYYGAFIANSARAKLLPLSYALPRGLADVVAFAAASSGFGLLMLGGVYALWCARGDDSAQQREVVRTGLFVAGVLLLLASAGGDSYALWRFYVPVLPVACALGARGVCELAARVARTPRLVQVAQASAIGLVLTARVVAFPAGARAAASASGWQKHWVAIGEALAAHAPAGARLALAPVGTIPYLSGLFTIDMLGLTEPAIARTAPDLSYALPGHQRHDGRHVLDRKPDLILLANGSVVPRPMAYFPWHELRPYERDLVADPRFARQYILTQFPLASGGFVQVFARRHEWQP